VTPAARPPIDTPFVAPRDEVEARIARIWEALLRVGPLGVDDDFFDLGGESLTGFALLARVHDAFGVKLTVGDLFAGATTISGMAALVRARAAAA
jgi:hypothetical protein